MFQVLSASIENAEIRNDLKEASLFILELICSDGKFFAHRPTVKAVLAVYCALQLFNLGELWVTI